MDLITIAIMAAIAFVVGLLVAWLINHVDFFEDLVGA